MEEKRVNTYVQRRRRRRLWYRTVLSAAAVVVFATTYLLILPALTLEATPGCGKEQHIHTQECYLAPQPGFLQCAEAGKLHSHTGQCYDAQGRLICGYADYFLHRHDESCYRDGILVCGLPEAEEHVHDESCYAAQRVLVCTEEENTDVHTHESSCYTAERKLHQHTEACYDSEGTLSCAYAFCTLHTHTDACYDAEGTLLCGQEEGEEHAHTEACYESVQVLTCTLQEGPQGHQHTDACYGTERIVVCGREEAVPHEHTDACFIKEDGSRSELTVCGKLQLSEHMHSDACEPAPVLICGLEEHEHDESCYREEETTETVAESETEETAETVAESATEETVTEGVTEKSASAETETGEAWETEDSAEEITKEEETTTEETTTEEAGLEASDRQPAERAAVRAVSRNAVSAVVLDPYITGISFRQKGADGIWRPAAQAENGAYKFETGNNNLEFTINYTIPAGVVTPEKNTVTYQLPGAFEYKTDSGTIKWNNSEAGTYTIENGVITLVFDEDSTFFDTDAEFDGYITFVGDVSAEGSGSGSHYEFNDEVKIDYTITSGGSSTEISNDSSFNVSKSGNISADRDRIDYTLDITPGSNGATNVTFNDILEITGSSADTGSLSYGSVSVTDASQQPLNELKALAEYASETTTDEETGAVTVSYKDGESVVCTQVTTTDGKTIITPAEGYYLKSQNEDGSWRFSLPDMKAGDQYKVIYGLDLSSISDRDWVQSLNIKNTVKDSNGVWKTEKTSSITNRWIIKRNNGATENEDGNFEIGWEVTLNPDHKDMQLTDIFTDTLSMGSSIVAENSQVTVTVTAADGSPVKSGTAALSDLNGKSIGDIFAGLGLTVADGAASVPYAVEMQYVTTVTTATLPNGTNYITNTGSLERGGSQNSSGSTAAIENHLLTKSYDSTVGVSFEKIRYYSKLLPTAEPGEEEVIRIPWNCIVKIPEEAEADTSFVDTFEKESDKQILWATPEALQSSLRITAEGEILKAGDDYTIRYRYDGKDYTVEELMTEAGLTEEQALVCQVTGFSIQFTQTGLEKVRGKEASMSYQAYGTYADINKSESSGSSRTFTNTAQYGGNTSSAQYRYTSTYFDKFGYRQGGYRDGDSEQDIGALKEGKLAWRIETKLAGNLYGHDLTLTDYLPAGLELTYVGLMKGFGNDSDNSKLLSGDGTTPIEDGSYTGSFCYDRTNSKYTDVEIVVSTQADGRRVIAVTVPGNVVQGSGDVWFFLYIEAAIPDDSALRDPLDFDHQSQAFSNKAALSVNGTVYNQTDNTITVTNEKSQLDKSGIYMKDDSSILYELEINPGAQDLLPGSDILTLVDVLEYDPSMDTYENAIDLISGSVKAYYYEADDTEKTNKIYLPANGYDFSYTYGKEDVSESCRKNTLTVQIPDGITVYLEYEYKLYANQSYENAVWKIVNSASLSGVSYGENSDQQDIQYTSSSAGVSKNTLTFYKVDQDNYTVKLPGARFMLYQWKAYDDSWTQEMANEAYTKDQASVIFRDADTSGCWEWNKDKDGNDNYIFTSGPDGKFSISQLETGILYQLVETEAPVGYTRSDAGYYFYIHSSTNSEVAGPADTDGLDIQMLSGGNLIFIANENDRKIHATKVWKEGTEPKAIELTLYRGTGAGYTYADTLGESPSLTPVETKTIGADASEEELTVTWEDLPETDDEGRRLYYYVFETKVDGKAPQITSDGNVLFGGTYQPEYSNNNGIFGGNVIVTNYMPERRSISAEKVWAEGTACADVEFTLYQGTEKGLDYADTQGDDPKLTPYSTDAVKGIASGASGDALTVTWKDLPIADQDGNLLYYYVFETKAGDADEPEWREDLLYCLGNYSVSYEGNTGITEGTVRITNEAAAISVMKVWGDDQTHDQEVSVRLYSSTTAPAGEDSAEETVKDKNITLAFWNSNADGSYSFLTGVDGPAGKTYRILAQRQIGGEIVALTVDSVGCTKEQATLTWTGPSELTVISQKLENNQMTWIVSGLTAGDYVFYVTIDTNSWPSSSYSADKAITEWKNPKDPKLQMPEEKTQVSEITLNMGMSGLGYSENGLKYTWEALPQYTVENGEVRRLYYYVEETPVEGYYPVYAYSYNEDGSIKSVTVTNHAEEQPTEMSISAEKRWRSALGADLNEKQHPDSVQVQLYKTEASGREGSPYGDRITLGKEKAGQSGYSSDGWKYTWQDLPIGIYYVQEVDQAEGFEVSYQVDAATESAESEPYKVTVSNTSGTILIYNTETPVEITVVKQWSDGESNHRDEEVTMQLYSSVTAPAGSGGTQTDPTDESETESESETEPETEPTTPGTDPSTGSQGGEDSKTGKTVIVKAKEKDGYYDAGYAEAEIKTDSAIITIYYNNLSGADEATLTAETEGIKVEKIGTARFTEESSMGYLQYRISGLSAISGDTCILAFDRKSGWPAKKGERVSGYQNSIVGEEVSAALYEASAVSMGDFEEAEVSDEDSSGNGDSGLMLPDDSTPVGEAVSLSAQTQWSYTWSNLPATDTEGRKLYYYVRETSTEGYTTSYTYSYIDGVSSKGIQTVTVTNTPAVTPETIRITVQKEWVGCTSYSQYQVTVQLKKDGEVVESATLSDGKWSKTWLGLEPGHTYTVEEVKVEDTISQKNVMSNFASVVSSDQSGRNFTITNTPIGYTLPETGGMGTALMYTFGGLLVTLAAALLRYKQSQRGRGAKAPG